MASITCTPGTINKGTATIVVFNGVGTNWTSAPSISPGANGSLGSITVLSPTQCYATYTPTSVAVGTVVTFTDSTDGNITCTVTIVQSISCLPVVAPLSTTIPIVFTSTTAGWTSGSLPTINASAGTLSALTFVDSSHVCATFTAPASAQTITFTDTTDGNIICTLVVTATNVYTYTLQDMLNAGMFYGRWSSTFKFNPASFILFGLSANFSTAIFNGLQNGSGGFLLVDGSGTLSNPSFNKVSPANSNNVPAFSNTTEAQYNIYAQLVSSGGAGAGWSKTLAQASSTTALTIYSTAASKPSLVAYKDTWPNGTVVTFPTPPSPFNSDGTQNLAGNSSVSPPLLSGAFAPYGYNGYVNDTNWAGYPDVSSGAPLVGIGMQAASGTFGNFAPIRFNATTPVIYLLATGKNQVAGPTLFLPPVHVEVDGKATYDAFNTIPAPNPSVLQILPVQVGLDGSNVHEYSLHLTTGFVDRIILGNSGTFAQTPVNPRSSGLIDGDSHTQGAICWESWGNQAYTYGYALSQLTGVDLYNTAVAGNLISAAAARFPNWSTSLPVLSNGAVGTGGNGATATCTVSGGAVASVTITAGGKNYPGSTALIYFANGNGGVGALASAVVSGGVVQNTVTILNPGSGYGSTAPLCVISGGGNGILHGGVPEFFIGNIGFNDQGVTARATARAAHQQWMLNWLVNYSGPMLVILPYGSGNPYIVPTSGTYTTTFSDYDLVGSASMAIPNLIASYPQFGALNSPTGRIFTSDQSGFPNASHACGQNISVPGVNSSPPGWNHGGHFENYGYQLLAGRSPSVWPGILPDFQRMYGSIKGVR